MYQPTTPEALKNLGPQGVAEYKKLREEIKRREEKLKAATHAAAKRVAALGTVPEEGREGSKEQDNDQVKAEEAKKVHQLELRVQLQKWVCSCYILKWFCA